MRFFEVDVFQATNTQLLYEIGSVLRLYTPASPSVPEMEGIYATVGNLFFWICTLGGVYIPCISLARPVELPKAIQIFDVVSLLCRALLFPSVGCTNEQ